MSWYGSPRSNLEGSRRVTVTNPDLPLCAADVERTCLPLEQATMLPGAAYTDYEVFQWERANFFRQGWICAGHVEQVAGRGQFLTIDAGGENVLLVGDDDGLPRAFLNTCRHRGARLVIQPAGTLRRIQCPYHAWTYGFDGSLKNAPFTDGLENFDPNCFSLHEVRLAVVEGLVLLDLSGEAPPPQEHIGDLAPLLAAYRNAELRRGARIVYDVAANWKAIGENYSECLHCPGVHPELNRLSHYLSGETIQGAGRWCGGSMTLAEGVEDMTVDGARTRAPIAGVDVRSILYFLIFPNTLVSLHPDYVMLHTLWPKGPGRTEVVCEWFFEPEAIAAAGFDPSDAVEFWDQVNREDWEVCSLTQRGMESPSFTPGRYTTQEDDVHTFDVMVAERYLEALKP
jgi:Rieske 2Fe-2S family protein